MPNALDDGGGAAVRQAVPGTAMRMVAAKLAAHGFDVLGPELEESRRLTVTNLPGTTCEITVDDSGQITWEYWRGFSRDADPARVAGVAMRLLTDQGAGLPRTSTAAHVAGHGLQGIVGRQLEAKGMDVSLDVYADHTCFEVGAEIVVTNPSRPERGLVRVGDEAGLLWESGCHQTGSDPAAIADLIIAILADDIASGYIQRGEPALAGSGRGNSR